MATELDKSLVEAVMSSEIGSSIRDEIKDRIADSYSLRNSVKAVLDETVKNIVTSLMKEQGFTDRLIVAIRAEMSDQAIAELARKTVNGVLDRRY